MIAAEIIGQVTAAGGQITADGTDLVLTAPRPLPTDLLDSLKAHKPDILAAIAPPDPLPPLSDAAESRRQKVLAMLARDGTRYAVLVEDPNTDPVVMAMATPGRDVRRTHPQGPVRPVRGAGRHEGVGADPPRRSPTRRLRGRGGHHAGRVPLAAVARGPGRHRGGRHPSQYPQGLRRELRRGDPGRGGSRASRPGRSRELRDHPRRSALVVPGQRQRRQAGRGPQVPDPQPPRDLRARCPPNRRAELPPGFVVGAPDAARSRPIKPRRIPPRRLRRASTGPEGAEEDDSRGANGPRDLGREPG